MKKIVICTVLMATGAFSLLNLSNSDDVSVPNFELKNSYSILLGYDKSMGEKTIKAAVIDSFNIFFAELL